MKYQKKIVNTWSHNYKKKNPEEIKQNSDTGLVC